MPSRLLRSTPARVTVVLGLAFFLSLGLSAAIAFVLIRQELLARIDRSVADTYAIISQSYEANDPIDLVDAVASHAKATIADDRVYLLKDSSGNTMVGNLTAAPGQDGWSILPPSAVAGQDGTADYRVFSGRLGAYQLVVGVSLSEVDEVSELVLTSLGWAGAAFVVMVAATGIVVARRGQQRLDQISETMNLVSHGELDARIPLGRRNDDIDALSASVNAALDRLAALVEGMRQVSVDIAHELKTPLNRLGIALEETTEANERGEPVSALLDRAQAEGRRINTTFDALLRIAQIESGARRARFMALDLRPILENVADAYGPVAAEAGHSLHLEADTVLGTVHGDKDLITQLLANLVENAIRHCSSGSEINLVGRKTTSAVEIVVSDTGSGIPEGERDKVFRRLYRLEKSRTTSGSGLGLSLVKAVADLHSASVSLGDNAPGLIVTIRFPLMNTQSVRQP